MIRYRPLFHVDIAHDYFLSRGAVVVEAQADADRAALTALYAVGDFLEIRPTVETASVLAGHRMIFRTSPVGFMVAVRVDSSAADIRPMVPPVAGFRLLFRLRLTDPRFANYTELGPATSMFYRFANDSQNETAGVNYLSRPVPGFDPSRRYVAGEIRAEAAALTVNVFLALRDTGPAAAPVAADWRRIPADTFSTSTTYQQGALVLSGNRLFRALVNDPGADLTNAADWQPVGVLGNQYVTVADAILAVPGLLTLNVGDLALTHATVRVFPSSGTTLAAEQTYAAEQGTLGAVQVDLRGLTAGAYRGDIINASGTVVRAMPFFLAPRAATEDWFGVVEIGTGAGTFALFNNDGTLRAPRYVLRFLNRATRWRYIFPSPQQAGSGADVVPESGEDRILVTPLPRPLTRFGAGSRLQADSTSTPTVSEEILLPAPEVHVIRRQNTEWFSETHVPNFTVGP